MSPTNRLIHQESISAAHGTRLGDCQSCSGGRGGGRSGLGEGVRNQCSDKSRESVELWCSLWVHWLSCLSSPLCAAVCSMRRSFRRKRVTSLEFFLWWISLQLCMKLLAGEAFWAWILRLWGQDGIKPAPSLSAWAPCAASPRSGGCSLRIPGAAGAAVGASRGAGSLLPLPSGRTCAPRQDTEAGGCSEPARPASGAQVPAGAHLELPGRECPRWLLQNRSSKLGCF